MDTVSKITMKKPSGLRWMNQVQQNPDLQIDTKEQNLRQYCENLNMEGLQQVHKNFLSSFSTNQFFHRLIEISSSMVHREDSRFQ